MIGFPDVSLPAPSSPGTGDSVTPILTPEQLLGQSASNQAIDGDFLAMLMALTATLQNPGDVAPSFAKKTKEQTEVTALPPGVVIAAPLETTPLAAVES